MYQISIKRQQGFTLIEVLVTIVVMAIGLLGLAALQNTSLKFSYDSYLRTQTAFLANDIFDRIRANPTVLYDLTATTTGTGAGGGIDCSKSDANCAPAGMQQYDIRAWKALIDETFPDSTVTIKNDETTTGDSKSVDYVVTFKWDSRTEDGDNIDGGDDDRESFVYTARVAP